MLISGFLHWKMMKCFNKILITVVVLRCAYSNISWFVTYKYILLSNTFVQNTMSYLHSIKPYVLFVCLSVCLFHHDKVCTIFSLLLIICCGIYIQDGNNVMFTCNSFILVLHKLVILCYLFCQFFFFFFF